MARPRDTFADACRATLISFRAAQLEAADACVDREAYLECGFRRSTERRLRIPLRWCKLEFVVAHRKTFGIVATLALLTLASCASTSVPPSRTARTSISPSPAVARGCVASDFKVGHGGSGAYQGYAVYSMVLLNISGVGCDVNEAPPMTLTLESGAHEHISLGDPAIYEGVDIGSGQILHIMIGSPGSCTNPRTPPPAASLTVDLPGGSVVDNRLNLNVLCGAPRVLIFTPVDPPASAG